VPEVTNEWPKRQVPKNGIVLVEQPAIVDVCDFRDTNKVGAFSYTNVGCIIYSTTIGRYTSIGQNVLIAPYEHPVDRFTTHGFAFGDEGTFGHDAQFHKMVVDDPHLDNAKRTTIGNDVWIGANVFIRRGVTIGDGAIVAAGSVVLHDVEPYAVCGGVPAKIIKYRFSDAIIDELVSLKWWDYLMIKENLPEIDYKDIGSAIEVVSQSIKDQRLERIDNERCLFKNGKEVEINEQVIVQYPELWK